MSFDLPNMALYLSLSGAFAGEKLASALMWNAWQAILERGGQTGAGADISGAALGGRLRGDAAMLGQASANVGEAADMMGRAADGAGEIASRIGLAAALAEDFQTGALGLAPGDPAYTALHDDYQARYAALADEIDAILKNTSYNGMSLLDGSGWSGDERFTVTDAPGAARGGALHIQAGEDGFALNFSDLAADAGGLAAKARYALTSSPHDSSAAPNPDAGAELAGLRQRAANLAELYAGRAGGLRGQAAFLRGQADILSRAADARAGIIPEPEPAPADARSLLLDLALRTSGGLVNARG